MERLTICGYRCKIRKKRLAAPLEASEKITATYNQALAPLVPSIACNKAMRIIGRNTTLSGSLARLTASLTDRSRPENY